MENAGEDALAALRAEVGAVAVRQQAGRAASDEDLGQIRACVLLAAHRGASADWIAAEGHLSVAWVREVLGSPDDVLRDRSGHAIWVL